MDSIQNTMSKIIRNCDVCIDGNVVSKELLIKTFSGFISSTIEDKRHNVGIVLHTGSIWHTRQYLMYCTTKQMLMTLFSHFRQTTWYYAMTAVKEKANHQNGFSRAS